MQMNNIFLALGKHSKNDSSTQKLSPLRTSKQTIWSLEYNTIQYNTIQYRYKYNTTKKKINNILLSVYTSVTFGFSRLILYG